MRYVHHQLTIVRFFPSWPNDGHSGYVGILVLIFDVQSDLDYVIRYRTYNI